MRKRTLYSFLILQSIACFIVAHVSAQKNKNSYDIRCRYQMNYQPDSMDENSRKEEQLMLLINTRSSNSFLESYKQFLYDSSTYAGYKKTGNTFGSMADAISYHTKIGWRIFKYSSGEIKTIDKVNKSSFEYVENVNEFNWHVLQDTATISGLLCQKASCYFGHRNWIAWFAPSIPISDGPYKFCGLPGLIVKISDTQNYYQFLLEYFSYQTTIVERLNQEEPVPTKKAAFFAALVDYRDNAFERAQQGPHAITFTSGQDAIKKRLNNLARKDNNWIELYKSDN